MTSFAFRVEDEAEYVSYSVNLAEGAIEPPQQPEPLTILRRLRRFNSSMWHGGYTDQPHIFLMEQHVVIEMDIEVQNAHTMNAILAAQFKKNKETVGG